MARDGEVNVQRRDFLLQALGLGACFSQAVHGANVGPRKPYGPTPSARQLRWHAMEFYGFIHFTINTFTDKEWGYGDESPSLFNPTDYDADQIVSTAAAAGMKGLILTCKHHDGFLVRRLQPDTCLFRWVGNERGIAGDPLWNTLNKDDFAPGRADESRLNRGDRPGSHWVPAECDVSIRPGWFYHSSEDSKVKSAATLVDLYYASVGRGGSFLLNLAPDRRGQIPNQDVNSLREFHRIFDATFREDLGQGAHITASNTRVGRRFTPQNVIDRRRDTYWTSHDEVTTPELIVDLGRQQTFNVVRLREYLPLGQRVEGFALDSWTDNEWQEFAHGTSIGNCKLLRTTPVSTTKVRLRITHAPVCPAISEFALFAEPKFIRA